MTQISAEYAGARTKSPVRYHDRRTEERYQLDGIEGTLRFDSCEMRCNFMDVSLGGCCVRTEVEFEAGALAAVEVTMPLLGMQVELRGTTQWVGPNQRVGVRFDHSSPRAKNEFASLLTGLMDKSAAEVVKEVVSSTAHGNSNILALSQGMVLLPKATDQLTQQSSKPFRHKNKLETAQQNTDELWAEQRRLKELALLPDQDSEPEPAKTDATAEAMKIRFILSDTQTAPPDEREESSPPSPPSEPSTLGSDHPTAGSVPAVEGPDRQLQNSGSETWNANVKLLAGNAQARGVLTDLSLGGCTFQMRGEYPWDPGSRVEVEFQLQGLPFRIAGVTECTQEKQSARIGFCAMTRRGREELIQVLDELIERDRKGSKTK